MDAKRLTSVPMPTASYVTSDSKPRWVVFSTFDPLGRTSESAVQQVRAYREADFNVMVVDTSEQPCGTRCADWEREATCWFQRGNVGYDFGSFKAGLLRLTTTAGLESGKFDVIFANDSCFGPFIPLAPIIEGFDGLPLDAQIICGMTDSVQEFHHIQSYWIYFRWNVSHFAIEFFLHTMADAIGRDDAIVKGELALGKFLLSRECILKVLCPVHTTLARLARFNGWAGSTVELGIRRLFKHWKYNRDVDTQCLRHLLHRSDQMHFFNPVVLFGVQLHRLGALPFVKKSMLRENLYEDPAVPAELNSNSMTNAQVHSILR